MIQGVGPGSKGTNTHRHTVMQADKATGGSHVSSHSEVKKGQMRYSERFVKIFEKSTSLAQRIISST